MTAIFDCTDYLLKGDCTKCRICKERHSICKCLEIEDPEPPKHKRPKILSRKRASIEARMIRKDIVRVLESWKGKWYSHEKLFDCLDVQAKMTQVRYALNLLKEGGVVFSKRVKGTSNKQEYFLTNK